MSTKRIMEEIRAATKASEEDIKAMLQLHDGDANAAMLALLETPFQKVDGKKHKQPGGQSQGAMGSSSRQDNQGPRDRVPSARRDTYPASGSGRGGGRGGGRGPGGEGSASGRGGGLSYSAAGRGRGAPPPRVAPKPAPSDNNGYSADLAFPPVEPTAGSGYDDPSGPATASPAPAGGAWGAPASSAPAPAPAPASAPAPAPASAPPPPVGAWGAGNKTMAERLKAKPVAPPAPTPPAPVYHAPPTPAPAPMAEEPEVPDYPYTSAGEYAEEEDHEDYAAAEQDVPAQAPDPLPVEAPAPTSAPAPQAPYPATWSNADVAKNLLNSLTKGAAPAPAAAAPSAAPPQVHQQTAQQAAQAHAAAVAASAQIQEEPAPSASDAMTAPQAAHYSAYAAAPPPKAPTAAEIEAQAMQLSFGNFSLGEFGGNFGAYAPPADAASSLMPHQQAQGMDPAGAGPHQDAYQPSSYNGYGGYMQTDKMSAQGPNPAPGPQAADSSRQTSSNAPNTFSSFGHGSTAFGAAFGSNFGSAAPEPSATQASYDAAQQAFGNYQDQLKQLSSYAGGNAAPGMAAYNMQQYQQQQQQQQQGPYNQPGAGAGAAGGTQQPAGGAAAGPSGGGGAPAGMPQAGAAGVPHQMHFANPQAAAAPGMAQYNAGLYNQPYPQFTPPYMANMGYNAYNMGYGYQSVGAYPPQPATGYAPNASAAYNVPHTQHAGGPRSQQQYSPYSNPAQAAGAPGAAGAPAGYAAAGQPAAYGLTGYEEMSSGAAGAINSGGYGMGKDKDTNQMYGGQQGGGYPQHARGGNNYGGGGYNPNQQYVGQGGYNQGNKGNYGGGGGGYNNRQQYNNQQYNPQQQQQPYGGPGVHGSQGGYNKGL